MMINFWDLGSVSGLETRLKEQCPDLLDIDGDICHHLSNAAQVFCKPFELYLENWFSSIHADFQWSPDMLQLLQEVCAKALN